MDRSWTSACIRAPTGAELVLPGTSGDPQGGGGIAHLTDGELGQNRGRDVLGSHSPKPAPELLCPDLRGQGDLYRRCSVGGRGIGDIKPTGEYMAFETTSVTI